LQIIGDLVAKSAGAISEGGLNGVQQLGFVTVVASATKDITVRVRMMRCRSRSFVFKDQWAQGERTTRP
jgi:hypothetical protein